MKIGIGTVTLFVVHKTFGQKAPFCTAYCSMDDIIIIRAEMLVA
jgi:hypothetical protein